MAENSNIEWTDHTFNPWEGCQKVGPGCDHCYAETRNARFGGGVAINWGPGAPRRRTSPANWRKPHIWNEKPFYECRQCHWRGHDANLEGGSITAGLPSCPDCDSMDLTPARPRVFCASLADVFDNAVPDAWRADLLDLIWNTPNLDWLLLTKRIGNANHMITRALELAGRGVNTPWPWSNVWLGATICNQAEADRDIPKLLTTPARMRFLSMEPLLGHVDLERPMPGPDLDQGGGAKICRPWMIQSGIDWVIAGGESGTHSRITHPDWPRNLRDQCERASVPFLYKQHGEWLATTFCTDEQAALPYRELAYIRRDGTVHDGVDGVDFFGGDEEVTRVGKKVAGRLLDGVEHNGFPTASSKL